MSRGLARISSIFGYIPTSSTAAAIRGLAHVPRVGHPSRKHRYIGGRFPGLRSAHIAHLI